MEEEFTDLQRLLRLKRHEAPPPDFLEDFLLEFHQRQRAEMLKRPLWRLALDRFEGALPNFQFQRYAYASACGAALVFAGTTAKQILTSPVSSVTTTVASAQIPSANPGLTAAPMYYAPAPRVVVKQPQINMYAQRPMVSLADLDFDKPRYQAAGSSAAVRNPRYVLEAQPVSYEQGDSF